MAEDNRAPNVAFGEPPYTPIFSGTGFRPVPNPLVPNVSPSPANPMGAGIGGDEEKTAIGGEREERPKDYHSGPSAEDYEVGGRSDKMKTAEGFGYQVGETAPGEALIKGLGLFSGIPGAGFLADKAAGKLKEQGAPWFDVAEGVPRAGTVGSIDAATGDVYGQNTAGQVQGYDPITGRATGNYTSAGGAWDSWNTGRQNLQAAGYDPVQSALGSWENSTAYTPDSARQLGVSAASRAGLMTETGEKSIQALLGGPEQHVSSTGLSFDVQDDGTAAGRVNAPGGGVTFASGNLKTDDTGKITGAYVDDGGDDDGGYTPSAAQVEAEKNVSLDAFGGSGDDSGGGGGGK